MAEDLNILFKQDEPAGVLDIISIGIKLFFSNIGFIFVGIFIPQLIVLLIGGYIISATGFQFNYSYLNSSYGLYAAVIVFITLVILQSITKFQLGRKFIREENGSKKTASVRNGIKIFLRSILGLLLSILSTVVLTALLVLPGLINLIFPMPNTYFHLNWVHQYKKSNCSQSHAGLINQIKNFWRRAYLVGLISRLIIILGSVILFFSLFLITEFWRIFFGGELFLFFEERMNVLGIIALVSILFFLFFSSITYLCFVVFYDFVSLKKEGYYLKRELDKIISDDTGRAQN